MSERPDSDGETAGRQVLCDIARTTFEVVNRLLSRDQFLSRELRSQETTSRQVYREECISVEMAATLRERFPRNVVITLFTPAEERRTGADWYWRFERGNQAIHARVQAKRVQRTEFGHADRVGYVRIDHRQLQDLIRQTEMQAMTDGFAGLEAWLATFARFDASPPCGQNDLSRCRLHNHERPCADHRPSLWIAKAYKMRSLNRARLTVGKVVEHSLRLDCILPCIQGPDSAVGRGPTEGPAEKGFKLRTGLPPFEDCVDRIQQNPALLNSFEGAMRIFV